MENLSQTYPEFIQSFSSKFYTDEEKKEFRTLLQMNPVLNTELLTPAILKGQYRLSYRLLERLSLLTTKQISGKDSTPALTQKKFEYKITKMELLLLLLLLQMCDAHNTIYDFSYMKDIAPLRDYEGNALFSKSTFYYAYHSLERKNIIHLKELDNGMITLSIPDNHIGKNEKYISLQTEFLLHDSKQYLSFREMKLASMKIYLFYLANTYIGSGQPLNPTPTLSMEQIKMKMGVKQHRTLRTYIKSLEKAFGILQFFPGGGKKRFIKGKLQMSNLNNNYCFAKRETLSDTQLNSFRRHFDKTILTEAIETDKNYNRLRTWAFMLFSGRSEQELPKLWSFLIHYIKTHQKLDMISFTEAANIIINAYPA